jgi:hypothetical protein
VNPVCEPDQYDMADADERPIICDCEDPDECWMRVFERDRYDTKTAGGRCLDFIPFELVDEDDAEDMAGLDDPRSLASLETVQ